MQQSRVVEIWVGIFIALGLAALFMLSMQVSNLTSTVGEGGYKINAHFENIGGLKVRSPVAIAGVRVGRVSDIDFDKETFEAVVTMEIDSSYEILPADTSASIFTAGLLGENYVGLEPGGEEEILGDGDSIKLTQSAVILEQLISQLLFDKAAEGDEEK